MSDFLSQIDDSRLNRRTFLIGPAGTGKTTYATQHLLRLFERGVPTDRVLVLTPQITIARPYQNAVHGSAFGGGTVSILTLSGLARRLIEVFWGLIAEPMGFANPGAEPIFLNVETAQYYMAQVAQPIIDEGYFDAVNVADARIVSQLLDNLNRAALTRFPVDQVAERLINAWGGERDSRRPEVYRKAAEIAEAFRARCKSQNLLDFSLMLESFRAHLMPDPSVQKFILDYLDYLIADNVEEDNPIAHDFIAWFTPRAKGALVICDTDGGYRNFLGADPDHALDLENVCDETVTLTESKVMSTPISALAASFNRVLGRTFEAQSVSAPLTEAVTLKTARFYPQMLDWAIEEAVKLVESGVSPREIVFLAPFLNDSMRFTLSYKLKALAAQKGISLETLSHRPSRALRDEPPTRVMITFAALAHPGWKIRLPIEDVADALYQGIEGIDPVRARLLAEIVYRRQGDNHILSPFAKINPDMQERITYLAGERFDQLREWIESYKAQGEYEGLMPVDYFWRRLFGEVLSQPGYGFHDNLEAGRVIAQLIDSAQGFRRVLYPVGSDWETAGREYVSFVNARLLPALSPQRWFEEEADAIFLAPASTFLLRNRVVDYQFWLDCGSSGWSERLEQPLTHPYVLRRDYPADQVWSDELEEDTQKDALYRIVIGLTRRCRKQIYLAVADLGESGYEQRGMLLRVLQRAVGGTDETSTSESSDQVEP